MYLAEEASVLVDKDRSRVNKHRCSSTLFGQGRHSQSLLHTVSHHEGSFGIVCQRDLKQYREIKKKKKSQDFRVQSSFL